MTTGWALFDVVWALGHGRVAKPFRRVAVLDELGACLLGKLRKKLVDGGGESYGYGTAIVDTRGKIDASGAGKAKSLLCE